MELVEFILVRIFKISCDVQPFKMKLNIEMSYKLSILNKISLSWCCSKKNLLK